MYDYLIWNNCANSCEFCDGRSIADNTLALTAGDIGSNPIYYIVIINLLLPP